jgi:hypothetical protein
MSNPLAIFSDENDALSAVVHELGGWKKVGCILRPELSDKPDIAAQWLRDCLNGEKREHLYPEQVSLLLKLARQNDFHAAKHWMDAELGYEPSKPLNPRDEAAELQRMFVESVKVQKHVLERLEKLTQPPLQSVRAA